LAAQVVHCCVAPLEEGLKHHFGVAVAAQRVAEAGELCPKRAKVVNLAVVANRPAAVRGAPRLYGPLAIDYLEPLSAELVPSLAERLPHFSALRDPVQHRFEDQRIGARPHNKGNTAHIEDPSCGCYRARSWPSYTACSSSHANGLTHKCQAWPSSMTLSWPASWRSKRNRASKL